MLESRNVVFWGMLLIGSTGCNANVRHLPVAGAVVVHACAAAEANAWMANGGDSLVETVTITLGASAESGGSATVGVEATGKAEAGIEAVSGTAKEVEVEMKSLPSFAQCRKWGYVPQLGDGGCLLGTRDCSTAKSDPPSPKNGRGASSTVPESGARTVVENP